MRTNVIFVFACFVIDSILAMLFPINYASQAYIFIPSLGFCALVLTIRRYNIIDGVLFAGCFGIFYDFFYANTYFINFIIYVLIAWLAYIWRKHMTETIIESIVLCVSTIFVKELLLYCMIKMLDQSSFSFSEWFIYREFLTLSINALMVFVLVSVIRMKDEYLLIQESKIRKEEKIEWIKFISKR